MRRESILQSFFFYYIKCPSDILLTCTVHNTAQLADEDNVLYIFGLAAYTTFPNSKPHSYKTLPHHYTTYHFLRTVILLCQLQGRLISIIRQLPVFSSSTTSTITVDFQETNSTPSGHSGSCTEDDDPVSKSDEIIKQNDEINGLLQPGDLTRRRTSNQACKIADERKPVAVNSNTCLGNIDMAARIVFPLVSIMFNATYVAMYHNQHSM